MAVLYAKTGGGNWSAAGTWSTSSAGGADNSGPPVASTDVIFELLSGNVTIDAASVCRSLDTTSGTGSYGGVLTHTSGFTLSIGDATAGAGNVALKFNAGMTYSPGGQLAAMAFISTSATVQSITTAGKTFRNTSFNGSTGSWQLQDAWTVSGSWVFSAGSWDQNSQTINYIGGSSNFASGGKTYNGLLNITGGGAQIISNNSSTFTNLTCTGTAVKGDSLTLPAIITVTGILTLAGNSTINRLLVQSTTLGTATVFTNAGATMTWSNVDFRDISLSNAFDASVITGNSGNCGGNTSITFTPAATQYWQTLTTGLKTWETAGNWFLATNGGGGAGRVPLPQDDIVFDANSIGATSTTVTVLMPRVGKSVNWSNVTNSPTFVNTGNPCTMYGSLTLVSGMTFTASSSYTFEGRGSFTIANGGKSFAVNVNISAFGGSYTLQDAFITTGGLILNNGTFNDGGFNVTALTFSGSNSNTRAIVMGAGTWSITGNNGTVWNTDTETGLTLTRGNPIQFTYSGATGTRNIFNGATGGTEGNSIDVSITAGTDTVNLRNAGTPKYHNIDFTGFAGTWTNSIVTIYGNLTASTGMTVGAGANGVTFSATSGTQTITSNTKTLDFPLGFNGIGGTWQLQDNLTIGSTRTITLTNGTFDLNNKNLSMGLFALGSGTKTISLGSGTATMTNTGNVWNTLTNVANFTVTPTTGTILIVDTSNVAINFLGGGKTFGNIYWNRGTSTASNTLSGDNTFANFKDDGTAAHSILFTAGSTTTLATWNVSGSGAGNEITINSTTTATHALTKTGGGTISSDYLNIQHSIARPWSGAAGTDTWYAGTHSVDNQAVATAGNGWIFTAPPIPSGGGGDLTIPTGLTFGTSGLTESSGLTLGTGGITYKT